MRKKRKMSWKQFCRGSVGEITVTIQTDYAWQEQASCKTERLAGRSRNIFTWRHGQNIFPSSCPASAAWWNTVSLSSKTALNKCLQCRTSASMLYTQTDLTTLRTLVSRTQRRKRSSTMMKGNKEKLSQGEEMPQNPRLFLCLGFKSQKLMCDTRKFRARC